MLKIPIDYTKYLKDRIIIITGVGRSGTTILGKIIGSMQNCYYLFEPAIMKYLYFDTALKQAILFEDYLLPLVQGRNLNYNSKDDSFCGNYKNGLDYLFAWKYLSRRSDAIKYIEEKKPFWIIKTNEIADYDMLKAQFPGVRFVHIIRNGLEVVSSAVKKGWYTDEYMESQIIDYVDECGINVPWYLSEENKLNWIEWNQITRCACIWRTLVEKTRKFQVEDITRILPPIFYIKQHSETYLIKYEDLISRPDAIAYIINYDFHLTPTDLTWSHIEAIKEHQKTEHTININDIQEPEREKFCKIMEGFNYEY